MIWKEEEKKSFSSSHFIPQPFSHFSISSSQKEAGKKRGKPPLAWQGRTNPTHSFSLFSQKPK